MMLAKTLESPLDSKEIQPVHPKGNQSWIFIGRTDAEAETLILWPCDAKSWLIWKDPDAGKDWRQEEKGWQRMRWLDGIPDSMDMGLRKTPEDGEGQGNLACYIVHGVSKSRTLLSPTEQLNNNFFFSSQWLCNYSILNFFSSVQFSHSVVSDSLQPHESQHTRPPCPSPTQTHVHRVSDAIQPTHPLSSPSSPAPNPSQHQGLLQWVNSSHQVAKVLEFQLQHQSFQWTPRTDLL